jgi:hypothetical protein
MSATSRVRRRFARLAHFGSQGRSRSQSERRRAGRPRDRVSLERRGPTRSSTRPSSSWDERGSRRPGAGVASALQARERVGHASDGTFRIESLTVAIEAPEAYRRYAGRAPRDRPAERADKRDRDSAQRARVRDQSCRRATSGPRRGARHHCDPDDGCSRAACGARRGDQASTRAGSRTRGPLGTAAATPTCSTST